MMDREKVIKGLEHCANGICNECPYIFECWTTECNPAARDALTLLKAQEPMVMAGAELTDAELIEKIRKAQINLKPAVDAIPVEWLREKIDGYASRLKSRELDSLVNVLTMWEKDQEAR